MYEKLLAILSLVGFAIFLAVLGILVREPALQAVLVVTLAMAAYDFWIDAFRGGGRR